MGDQGYWTMGRIGSARVGVQHMLDAQHILIEHDDGGQRLAALLPNRQAQLVQAEGDVFWRIPHDQETDRLLVELIDLFISIRYAHPTLVQLELQLDEAGR